MTNTGYHVYPEEIEEAARLVPGVADVLVRGEPDPAHGQAVVAHLVTDGAHAPDALAEAVATELRSRLAGYKVPRRFLVSESLPPD
jgi:acyl-CoA synthetase (AMP-forming)/AMP-acid ligase II